MGHARTRLSLILLGGVAVAFHLVSTFVKGKEERPHKTVHEILREEREKQEQSDKSSEN